MLHVCQQLASIVQYLKKRFFIISYFGFRFTRVFPSEYCHDVWYRKTRMVCLPDGEISLKIRLLVLTECTNVTDRQTDGRTPHDGTGHTCIASRGKNHNRNCATRNKTDATVTYVQHWDQQLTRKTKVHLDQSVSWLLQNNVVNH